MELVTEAETLRKIQVKHGHGLAGSFKDRPIAEWLQVQNPTELEYQKVRTLEWWFVKLVKIYMNS